MRKLVVFFIVSIIVIWLSVLAYNNKNTNPTIVTLLPNDCRLQKTVCEVFLSDGSALIFELKPKSFPAMELITLKVSGFKEAIKPPKLWFEGKDMYMGRHFLLPETRFDSDEMGVLYKGMIPVCSVDDDMVWLLSAEIPDKGQISLIQFQLQATPAN